jgi:hypothetical protein
MDRADLEAGVLKVAVTRQPGATSIVGVYREGSRSIPAGSAACLVGVICHKSPLMLNFGSDSPIWPGGKA